MSSRHFKKVYGESQSEDLKVKSSQHSDDDDVPVVSFRQRKTFAQNPYELLTLTEDSDKTEETSEHDQEESEKDTDIQQATSSRKKKKKRRGKNKSINQIPNTTVSTSDATSGQSHSHHRLTKPKDKGIHPQLSNPSILNQTNLFSLDQKFLNPEFELKKIFGASVINNEMGKSGRGHRKCLRALGRCIAPRGKWPSVASSGISMSILEPKEMGVEYFKFEHNAHYQEVQKQFMRAVDSHDPENILSIVRLHPYHIDSQIQLSDMSKQSEDSQVAAELVEIALHAMELGADPRFLVASTNCRLEYKYQENRAFHILLYKHLTFVGLRACHRTAVELCKVLLNLDPADPLCVTLMLDFYAIKAGECQWFVNVYNLWNGSKNLCQLPNWSFSVALAQFLLSIGAEDGSTSAASSSSKHKKEQTNSLSDLEREAYGKQSDELLQYSILMFPLVLIPLLDKIGIQSDTRVRNHAYFNYGAQNSSTDALRLLCNLYVWRSNHLWKNPKLIGWIEKNTHAAIQKVERRDPVVHEYDQQRKRRYRDGTTPRNVIRHIILTDEKELTVNIPSELSKEAIVMYDPLPPRDSIDIYHRRLEVQVPMGQGQSPGILNALFHSFGIEFNIGQPQPQQPPHAPGIEEPAPGAGALNETDAEARGAFHRSVNVFMEAMRNLLTVATSDDPHRHNEESDSSSDDEELPALE